MPRMTTESSRCDPSDEEYKTSASLGKKVKAKGQIDIRSDTNNNSETKAENDQSLTHTKEEVSDDDYNNLSQESTSATNNAKKKKTLTLNQN